MYAWFFAGAQSVVAQENVLPTHEYYTEEYIAKIYIEEPMPEKPMSLILFKVLILLIF